MKTVILVLISLVCFSFRPSVEKTMNDTKQGFYITVEDLTDRSFHKYIVLTKDSVHVIFNHYFDSELDLGEVDYPISIYNGKRNFYIARVTVFEDPNGKMSFKHLDYPDVFIPKHKRAKLKPAFL